MVGVPREAVFTQIFVLLVQAVAQNPGGARKQASEPSGRSKPGRDNDAAGRVRLYLFAEMKFVARRNMALGADEEVVDGEQPLTSLNFA